NAAADGVATRLPGSLPDGTRCWPGALDPGRAFGAGGDRFYKIAQGRGPRPSRRQDLRGEFELLRRCRGLAGVPEALELIGGGELQMLVLRKVPGQPLSRLQPPWSGLALIMLRLSAIVWALARRGVRHNDLRPDNIMVAQDGRVHLVDFDQASRGSLVGCLLAGIGLSVAGVPVWNGLLAPLRERLQAGLSPRLIRALRATPLRSHRQPAPASLPAEAGPELQALEQAWRIAAAASATSPGERIAYYELEFKGIRFAGERPWGPRWNRLRHVTPYAGRRVLELGCNLGLFSTFALKDARADAALAVDADPAILEAAAKVAGAFGVAPEFRVIDFDRDPGWEDQLEAFRPDVVVALSVLHWVEDQARFLAFLGRFDEVVFEGHDSSRIERERLRQAGFTEIDLVDTSERGRPILLARKG
ncbi:MAG: methyltransferase, partial [Geminicoccaceae bacterium]